ncbi:hypothetical protein LB566_07725 [Mesorhizobium sp. CA13]|uniref:hypothetical protein n=1 Tax=Mesorhizobium sp. CA13 TaxID=2876643 RepID=UPI001CCDEA1D|nr:hypothetical protein [Mesorhizobium sp. CA13]MBZ9853683.1 hypothetical protein [Mesorhizobium sp. CA13]
MAVSANLGSQIEAIAFGQSDIDELGDAAQDDRIDTPGRSLAARTEPPRATARKYGYRPSRSSRRSRGHVKPPVQFRTTLVHIFRLHGAPRHAYLLA